MIAIVALDDRNGMMFNHRRQSQDRELRKHILNMVGSGKLWMNGYSAKLFEGTPIIVDEDFLDKAQTGDYCWVEDKHLAPYADKLEQVVTFKWNRKYPGDFYFDLPLEQWSLVSTEEFSGSSHEKITKEVYER